MYEKNKKTIEASPISRRDLLKVGAGAVIAVLGAGALPATGEAHAGHDQHNETDIDALTSNSFLYDGFENVDPNIFTGKSPEEQADIITIHEELDETESSAVKLMEHLALLFNAGQTDQAMKDNWEQTHTLDSFLIFNANNNFSPLQKNLLGPDIHEALLQGGLDIAEVNQTLENMSHFKSQLDTRFVYGVKEYQTANTSTTPTLNSFEQIQDAPSVYANGKVLRLNVTFSNKNFDVNGEAVLEDSVYTVDAILEIAYDTAAARTMVAPHAFTFNQET